VEKEVEVGEEKEVEVILVEEVIVEEEEEVIVEEEVAEEVGVELIAEVYFIRLLLVTFKLGELRDPEEEIVDGTVESGAGKLESLSPSCDCVTKGSMRDLDAKMLLMIDFIMDEIFRSISLKEVTISGSPFTAGKDKSFCINLWNMD
jgi:hypothetical protein